MLAGCGCAPRSIPNAEGVAGRAARRAAALSRRAGLGRPDRAYQDLDKDGWQSQLALLNKSVNYQDWRVGVVIERAGRSPDRFCRWHDGAARRACPMR
jgi:hypothetical protein